MVVLRGVISYPIPAESNPPIEPQFYQPNSFVISAITRGITTIVTNLPDSYPSATVNNNYTIGQLVRFILPIKYGIRQLNNQTGYVISIPGVNQVEVAIDSTFMDAFIPSPTFILGQDRTLPQILAIGDISTGPINASGPKNLTTFIPGSFIDIS